jgi:hypothetical protein
VPMSTDQPAASDAAASAPSVLRNASVAMREEGIEWMTVLADVLQAEAVWAHDVGGRYPADHAPLLAVATTYLQGLPADHPLLQEVS